MKGVSWNSRSLGTADKRKHARSLVDEYGLDFIGIQETQLEVISDAWLDQIGSRQEFFWAISPSAGRSGGIMVGVRRVDYEVLDVEYGLFFCKMPDSEQKR